MVMTKVHDSQMDSKHAAVHLAAELGHLGALGVGRQPLRGVVESLDLSH
jgi:hypothetical protein